ncbi:MAG: cytochrome c biogenesis protein CcsA [Rikenellaceae bacterium]
MKKFISILYIMVVAVLIAATFVESTYGTEFITDNVYGSNWFSALWALLTVGTIYHIVHKLKKLNSVLLHSAFLIILLGAGVTHYFGVQGKIALRKGRPEVDFYDSDYKAHRMPFSIKLNDFWVDYYAGGSAPSNYTSSVTIKNKDKQESFNISMNNILEYKGYRLYQSSYDSARKNSVLSINYDPWGNTLTYIGYWMLFASFGLMLISPKSRFRKLLKHPLLRGGTITTLALMATTVSSYAISPTIATSKADSLSQRQIIYQDRVAPFNTMSRDILQKIYGESSYEGLSSDEVVGSWLVYPDYWQDEPVFEIKNQELAEILQCVGAKYIALSDLYYEDGTYKLFDYTARTVDHAGQTPLIKAVAQIEEKMGIIDMLLSGELFQIIPKDGSVERRSQASIKTEIVYNSIPYVKILFMFNLTMGLLALISIYFAMFRGVSEPRWRRLLFSLSLLFSFAVVTVLIAIRWYLAGRIPLSNGYETMLFLSWSIMAISVVLMRRVPHLNSISLFLSGLTLLVVHISGSNPQITELIPVLNSPWLTTHVSFIMISYAIFGIMALQSIVALAMIFKNKKRYKRDIELLSLLNNIMLYPSSFLLGAGIFIGAIWANNSWGRYWGWDPKEVWALITFMCYAILFHRSFLPSDSNKKAVTTHVIVIVGFIFVLMTYFGVNFILGGMHSYK